MLPTGAPSGGSLDDADEDSSGQTEEAVKGVVASKEDETLEQGEAPEKAEADLGEDHEDILDESAEEAAEKETEIEFRQVDDITDFMSCDGGTNRVYPDSMDVVVKYIYDLRVEPSSEDQMRPLLTAMEKSLLKELLPTLCKNDNFLSAAASPFDMVLSNGTFKEIRLLILR
jgi:hypothetical protein